MNTEEPSVIDVSSLQVQQAPEPLPITIDDLLSSIELRLKKEETDKTTIETIVNISHEELKTKLINWAKEGFPNVYEIHTITIQPPAVCSDNIVRSLTDYITFCSGKTLQEHISVLQSKVTGMTISFSNMGSYIAIVVSKL